MKLPEIVLKAIPHDQHRYSTCGDFFIDENGVWQFRVSETGNPDYEFLVLLHELVEWYLTQKRGISEPEIKAFDEVFEAARQPGNNDEPGDCKEAPYYCEHQFATGIERLMCAEMGADWNDYDNALIALFDE